MMVYELWKKKSIWMILDFHGHSRMKKIFMYGCSTGTNYVKCREFPFLLSKLSHNFEYRFCNFSMEKDKQSTARVSFFREVQDSKDIYAVDLSVWQPPASLHNLRLRRHGSHTMQRYIDLLPIVKTWLSEDSDVELTQVQ